MMSSSPAPPEKRPAEVALESERQKRMRVISDFKQSLLCRSPVAGVDLSIVDDFVLRSGGWDLDTDNQEWNQIKKKLDTFIQESQPFSSKEAVSTIVEEDEDEDVESELSDDSLNEWDYEPDGMGVYVEKMGKRNANFSIPPPDHFCIFCEKETDHPSNGCPDLDAKWRPSPPPPTPQQLEDGQDYYCGVCQDYTDHGLHNCPIENNVYQLMPDGSFKKTKCGFCRQALHSGPCAMFL